MISSKTIAAFAAGCVLTGGVAITMRAIRGPLVPGLKVGINESGEREGIEGQWPAIGLVMNLSDYFFDPNEEFLNVNIRYKLPHLKTEMMYSGEGQGDWNMIVTPGGSHVFRVDGNSMELDDFKFLDRGADGVPDEIIYNRKFYTLTLELELVSE
ncbi:MAG: hypothetical protein ACI89L_002383 [Phycisphaerales bacterium]|jgi:hypothetical protein